MESGREEIFFFEGGNGKRLLGFLHRPAAAQPSVGVVYCHPFAEEKNLSHAVTVRTARRMAESGMAVLRFDLSGCGDSEGELSDASLHDWLGELRVAGEILMARTGVSQVGYWGLRAGANLALIHAQGRKDIPFLLLWQPLPGLADAMRVFLRQSISTSLAKGQGAKLTVKDLAATIQAGGIVEVIGYPIGKSLYESMLALDAVSLPTDIACPAMVLTFGPPDLAPLKVRTWLEGLQAGGAQVERLNSDAVPFWDRYWQWDAPGPAQQTVDWAASRRESPRQAVRAG